jgi:hypothetical protein
VPNSTIRRPLAVVTRLRLNFGYIASFANAFPPPGFNKALNLALAESSYLRRDFRDRCIEDRRSRRSAKFSTPPPDVLESGGATIVPR